MKKLDNYDIDTLIPIANMGLGGNTETEKFKKLTKFPFSYTAVTNALREHGCERLWVGPDIVKMVKEKTNELEDTLSMSESEYHENLKEFHAEIERRIIKENDNKDDYMEFSLLGDTDPSRHTLTMDNDLFISWEAFCKPYRLPSAVLNIALAHFMNEVRSGKIRIIDENNKANNLSEVINRFLK